MLGPEFAVTQQQGLWKHQRPQCSGWSARDVSLYRHYFIHTRCRYNAVSNRATHDTTDKGNKKRKSSSEDSSVGGDKAKQRKKKAMIQAAGAMKSELATFGYAHAEDFGKKIWDDFKKEDPEKVDAIVEVRKKVLSNYSINEDRLIAVNILQNHWHNRRRLSKGLQNQEALNADENDGDSTHPENDNIDGHEDT